MPNQRFGQDVLLACGMSSALMFTSAARTSDTKPPGAALKAGDWEITVSARKALWADAQLAPLNLGITVVDGVATVWGPVPSRQLLEEAVARVRLVRGIREVVNELYVVAKDDAKAGSAAVKATDQFLVPRVETPEYKGTVRSTLAAYLRDTSAIDVASAPTNTTGKPGVRAVELLPPVPAPPSNLPVQVQIDRLRLSDRRYNNLRIEFKDGHVTVYGTVAKNRDAWDFADSVRQVGGVTKVTLKLDSEAP